MGKWTVTPWTKDDTKKWEFTQNTFDDKYCPSCDYGFDDPEDSCLCDENCGAIGCQGSNHKDLPQNA